MMVSLFEQVRENINDNHSGSSYILFICEKPDDNVNIVNSAKLEVAAITNVTTMHESTEKL